MRFCITTERGRKLLILKDKSHILHVRLPLKDLEYLKEQAAVCNMDVSAYVRSLLTHFKNVKRGYKSYANKQTNSDD